MSGVRYETDQTCLTLREEVESLAHVIAMAGLSPSIEAFDVKQDDAERSALSTLQKVLDFFDEWDPEEVSRFRR